ncbi:hypothetical protein [Georgenia sp. SUBG003]|uniref:hypothetical protein n=1 Tax=Georgenia sp. SUBG003 TaxID=1497974 RepID=UPI003AB24BBA
MSTLSMKAVTDADTRAGTGKHVPAAPAGNARALNGISPATHWSYTSAPAERSTMSSMKSVAGQPVAPPDSMPAHQGLVVSEPCSSAMVWVRVISSSHVFGTS